MSDVFLPVVEMQCIGSFKLLFYLLRVQLSTEVQAAALDVINIVTTNQECVNDIAASEVLAGLLLVIPTLPKSTILILETLYALISNTKIVKELMQKGKSTYTNIRVVSCQLQHKSHTVQCSGPGARQIDPKIKLKARILTESDFGLSSEDFQPPTYYFLKG